MIEIILTPIGRRIATDRVADALVADEIEVVEAVARLRVSLAAWAAFPRHARIAYPAEARRLARRAATALAELVEVASIKTEGATT